MAADRFPIRVGARSAGVLRVIFGVHPDNAFLEIGEPPDGDLLVSFGRTTFRTPMANVVSWRVEGPWVWIKAIGIRMSLRHHDVAFDGSAHGGIRVDFREPVRWSFLHVPAIYASVDDLDAAAAAFAARGIPGEDVRAKG